MKLNKAVRKKYQEYKENAMVIHLETVEDIIRRHTDKPNAEELIQRERRRAAQRLIAEDRDSNGAREVLATDGNKGTFVVIEQCDDLALIESAIKQLRSKLVGIGRTHKKAALRRQVLRGQIHMEDLANKEGNGQPM